MKKSIAIAAVLFAVTQTAAAQYPAGMSEADMQKMMQGVQEMQACMQKVDQDAMERLGEESERLEAEIKSLCAAGKRDAAQERAMAFGMKMANDPAMKVMAECSKKMAGLAPKMPYVDTATDDSTSHVCDD